ncbi:MAG: hypothetical protein ACYCYM_10620 [Saccharofermentanales bacterium]
MKETAIAIFLIGLILSVYSVFKRDRLRVLMSAGLLFFLTISVYFLLMFDGQKFITYDNFSHWATIVKTILLNNRLPNFLDTTIVFQSYPPGSACFIYYVCKIVSGSESMMMFAQALLIFSSLTAVFGVVKKNKPIGFLLAASFCVFVISYNLSLYSLLVDLLLPALGLASVLIANEYRENPKKAIMLVTPILCFLMVIKNSGTYFVAFTLLFLFFTITPKSRANLKYMAFAFIAPVMTLLIWQKHVRLVFASGLAAKHSMSAYNFYKNFLTKSNDEMRTILNLLLKRLLVIDFTAYIFIALIVLILIVGFLKLKLSISKKCIFISVILGYVGYQLSLLGMYVLSMPMKESLTLAGYARYNKTIIIFIFGLLVYYLIDIINHLDFKTKPVRNIVCACLAILLYILLLTRSGMTFNNFQKQDNSSSLRYKLDELLEIYPINSGKSYIICHNTNDYGYVDYIGKYTFMTNKISSVIYTDEKSLAKWRNYDYLIILERNDQLELFLENNFSNSHEENVIVLAEYK